MRNSKEFVLFCVKVSLLQFVSYFVFGVFFSVLFNYQAIWGQPIISSYLKPFSSTWVKAGPLFQFGRGIIIGFILWFIIDFFHSVKFGWLKLWGVFAVIGIIATPMASPGSMEGVIFSQLPLWFHLIMLPEVLLQTLMLSWLILFWDKKRFRMKPQAI